jgi:hypothetical protein
MLWTPRFFADAQDDILWPIHLFSPDELMSHYVGINDNRETHSHELRNEAIVRGKKAQE